jgi:hypothetical protein
MTTRLLLGVATVIFLTAAGCQSTGANSSARADDDAAPVSLRPAGGRDEGGMLLRTGSILLGPGVGRNQWHWLGDGEGGF